MCGIAMRDAVAPPGSKGPITSERSASEPERSHVWPQAAEPTGPHREDEEPKPMMIGHEKSDSAIVCAGQRPDREGSSPSGAAAFRNCPLKKRDPAHGDHAHRRLVPQSAVIKPWRRHPLGRSSPRWSPACRHRSQPGRRRQGRTHRRRARPVCAVRSGARARAQNCSRPARPPIPVQTADAGSFRRRLRHRDAGEHDRHGRDLSFLGGSADPRLSFFETKRSSHCWLPPGLSVPLVGHTTPNRSTPTIKPSKVQCAASSMSSGSLLDHRQFFCRASP